MSARVARHADARLIAALALFAGLVRLFAWHRTAALFNDGPIFIGLARLMGEGEWAAVIAHPYHPLYPLAVATAQLGIGDWETAAATVSVAAGVVSVVALFVFLRDAFDRQTATIGAAILAIHPYAVAFSSDVQSDGLYLALFLTAVATLWKAAHAERLSLAAAAGGVAGLAYLVRPEGVGVLIVGVAFGGLGLLRGRWRPRFGMAWIGALTAGALLVMSPYVLALRGQTGRWLLTQKKSVAALSGGEATGQKAWSLDARVADPVVAAHPFLETIVRGPRSPAVELAPLALIPVAAADTVAAPTPWQRHSAALTELYLAVISTLRPELFGLLIIGVASLRRFPSSRGTFVLGFAGLYLAVLYGLAFGSGYVSRRHALPPVAVAFGYVALGAPILGRWILSAARRIGLLRPSAAVVSRTWVAAAVGALLVVAIAAPKALQSRRGERLASRQAAEWLRNQPDWEGGVAAPRLRVAYYADAPFVPLPPDGSGAVMAYLRAAKARYMIIDDHQLGARSGLSEVTRESMQVVYRTQAGGRSAAVFAIEPAR